MSVWTQAEAIELAVAIEAICPEYGCHVALTGGLLYKPGPRKDADFLFYRIRDWSEVDVSGLFSALAAIAIIQGKDHGWCKKATYHGKPIDFFFPDDDGSYPDVELSDIDLLDMDAVEDLFELKAEDRKDRADIAALQSGVVQA
jgi:hypothetical protein